MDPLFGSAWQFKTQTKNYQNSLKSKQQYERPMDYHGQFQNALYSNFTIRQNSMINDTHKYFRFSIENKKERQIQVCLFFYNYKNMAGKLICGNPTFSYKLSSIYKLPLSQHQWTSFIFHHLFNFLEAENLFISIQFLQKEARLVIQFSRYESDIINMSQGNARLSGTYWKPTLVEKSEDLVQRQLSLIVFLQKIINQLQNVDEQAYLSFRQQNRLSFILFKLFHKPLNFVSVGASDDSIFDLYDHLSGKQAVSFRKSQYSDDLEAQYTQTQSLNRASAFNVIIYIYNFKHMKELFRSNDLLFSYKEFVISKRPICQKQYTNAFFKQTILTINSTNFFISLEVNAHQRLIVIQISNKDQEILNKFRGRNRFDSQYWKCSEEKRTQQRQGNIESLENIISVVGGYMNQTSILGSWKASNNIIDRLAAYLT